MPNIKWFYLILIVAFSNINLVFAYNILVMFGHPAISHFNVFSAFFKELADKGHNVTIISHVEPMYSKNIRHIRLADEKPVTHGMKVESEVPNRFLQYYSLFKLMEDFSTICEEFMPGKPFQDFLKEDNQYDLVMVEFFNTNCYYGLATKFNAPFIGLSTCSHVPWHSEWFGVNFNPAYVPSIISGFKAPMSFLTRVENTILNQYANLWYKRAVEKQGNEQSKKYSGYEAADPHNASLLLINTHYTFDGVKPLPPSIIEVGGIHVHNKTPKKLPVEIESWINGAEAGVIYFSLGSMIKGTTFPEKQRRAFGRVFAKLPQRVVWKWENESMPDKPENVLIGKWMPQFDILCNPNVKLFISHGGLLGTIEAIHCGVPIIIMPQFGDQAHNARAMEATGAGVFLHLQTATEEQITAALKKGLDPQTQKNAKLLSEKFKDRPLSPMDTAIYWVEHVARHRGASHMRSPAIDMPFYQLYLLDVYGFLIAIVLGVIYIFYVIFRLTRRLTEKVQKLKSL